jgi:hypothetical protein
MTRQSLLIAAEDELSCAVMQRLIEESGRPFLASRILNTRGNDQLKKNMDKFKAACRVVPHIVLTDLDRHPCPPALIKQWQANVLPSRMLFRIAVREVEAWLLADREGIAKFLDIAINKLPHEPEAEAGPKRTLINLARKSRKRRLAQELVPEAGSAARIGPLYNARMREFVGNTWNIQRACDHAPSLARAVSRLLTFLPE